MTYEYVCTACAHEWEADHAISAPPLKECPSCHKATAKRQISGGTGFVLKGGGWYSDLYSSTKPPAKDAKDSGTTASGSDSGSSKESSSKDSGSTAKSDTTPKSTTKAASD
jgi:putative FmdB family regulatory protein